MTKLAVVFVLVLSLFALSAAAGEWTGWITDSKCGAKSAKAEHQACAQKCVKGGLAPILVSEGKVLKIADASKVQDHVGQKVTVSGKLDGDTVTIDSVKTAE